MILLSSSSRSAIAGSGGRRRRAAAEARGGLATPARRAGVALITILFFLVVAGLLAAGAAYSARQASRATEWAVEDAHLIAAADDALLGAVARWDAAQRSAQPSGTTQSLSVPPSSSRDVSVNLSATRLTPTVYALVASAVARDGRAARRAQLLVRVPSPSDADTLSASSLRARPVVGRPWSDLL